MKIVRSIYAVIASLMLAVSLCGSPKAIGEPKGFDNKVFHATMALSATSTVARVESPKFLCTVTAYKKVDGGYLLIGAGHCTGENNDLPPDLKFYVGDDIGSPVHEIQLLKAEYGNGDGLDFAIYFYPTTDKYPTISLGDEHELSVGDKTVNVNFSLGVSKITSPGIVSDQGRGNEFLVQEFASHGASGSSVVSEKSHKIVGLLVGGWDGATMPAAVESISGIEAELEKLNVVYNGKTLRMAVQDTVKVDVL